MKRAIVLHRRSHEIAPMEALRDALTDEFRAIGLEAEVVTARQDYLARAESFESFSDWNRDVGQRNYDLYVVPDMVIGRATADIIGFAIARECPVVYTADGHNLQHVIGFKLLRGGASWIDYGELHLR